ncbi:RimJ/RimL family protein N-acetyltransferase [Streptacidiphilus sp. MAP12-16]|uniref:GNAT family N-acetyltransferase n=1 Tax=Streptacidiphilus sp. MAP12-16 TaxID=3156300 RepID=UPI0035182D27
MEPVILETPRLILRPFAAEDAPRVYRECQDEEIQRWIPVPVPYTAEDARIFVGEVCPVGWREGTMLNFGSFTRDGGALVSSMGVHLGVARPEGVAEIGFWTAREHRGRGYTAEAASTVCRWAFLALEVQRMEWLAIVGNAGSRAVAEKVGFTVEGTLRSRLNHRGVLRDAWIGSLLPSDLASDLPSGLA